MSQPYQIEKILEERVMVLDGAMGTMIQGYKLEEKDFRGEQYKEHKDNLQGNNDLLSVTRPDIIADIHRAYFEAGADIVETNTFNANRISQADYNLESEVWAINTAAASVARKVADELTAKDPDKPRFVAGSIGPTNKTASISPDVNDPGYRGVTFDELVEAYKEQIKALMEGGVDILMVETVFDTLNAKAALFAIMETYEEEGRSLPIMISGTITDASGRTLSGQTTEAFLISISHAPLLSVGLNCALGAKELRPYLYTMSTKSNFFVSAHPNAGLPNEFGEYDQSPEEMAQYIQEFLEEGMVNIVGGCCGTTPEHIRAIAEVAKKHKPRQLLAQSY